MNFIIRSLTEEDGRAAMFLGSLAWNNPVDIDAKLAEHPYVPPTNKVALFTEDGVLVCTLSRNEFQVYFEGEPVPMLGIGGVCTLPEYRRCGAVRQGMAYILNNAYDSGVVFSALWPFAHGFYRKFGYEMAVPLSVYTIPTELLAPIRSALPVRRLAEKEETATLTSIRNQFVRKYNMAVCRNDVRTDWVLRGDTNAQLISRFLLGDKAYVCFDTKPCCAPPPKPNPPMPVKDWGCTELRYLPEVLSALGRYYPNIQQVRLEVPCDLMLETFFPTSYPIEHKVECAPMVRVVNVKEVLTRLRRPTDASFTVEVHDDLLAQNDGVWRVGPDGAEKTDRSPDLVCDIRALAPMVLGAWDLDQALIYPGVQVNGNEATLREVFIKKRVYMSDFF